MANLIKAIGPADLTKYFEYLDDLRESGKTNMWGATPYLMRRFRGMAREEASEVLGAWQNTFSITTPAEDRADAAIERAA